ncbi:MAG: MFS transporter [Proteobacteria bacterium]|nr:MFS transporter [Pseudomonadota bacterium]
MPRISGYTRATQSSRSFSVHGFLMHDATGRRNLWTAALAVTLLMQATSAFLVRTLPVIGPVLTEAAGVRPERIGLLASITSLGTMWFLISGGPLLPRLGAARLLQIGSLLGAAGLALVLTGDWPAMMLAALLIGIGYGPSPPAGSDILARYAPTRHRSLVFSIKQAGVPLGGAVAGLMLPSLADAYGWQVALIGAAVLAAAAVVVVQPLRTTIDAERDRGPPLGLRAFMSLATVKAPFRAFGIAPGLPRIAFAGFAFAMVQGTLFSFYVTFLTSELALPLAAAGLAFAVMQVSGVFTRVLAGWLADRLGSNVATLIGLSFCSSLMTAVTAATAPAWPPALLLAVAALTGIAVSSWNGLCLAEVARLAPPGAVGDATAGSTFVIFIAYVIGPSLIEHIVHATGSYPIAFLAVGVFPMLAGIVLLANRRRT